MSEEDPSGWAAGWATFAAFMLMIAGALEILTALTALFNDEFFVTLPNYTFRLDITTWGWIHLLIGIVVFACGIGILKGHVLGRTVGALAAAGTMIANFAWIPYYPIWSIAIMAICLSVIWALTVHGRDAATLLGE